MAYFFLYQQNGTSRLFFQQWYGVVLGVTCLIQFFVSLCIDHQYDKAVHSEPTFGSFGIHYFSGF